MDLDPQVKMKYLKDLEKVFREIFTKRLEELVEDEIQPLIISKYDDYLVDVVTDRNSKANPNFYREDFVARVEEFEYLPEGGDLLVLPDMENFDFSGRLRIIQDILEGTLGRYVEITKKDFTAIFNHAPHNQVPIDEYVPPDQMVYKVKYSQRIKNWFADQKKDLVPFPFSNTPPFRLFEEVNEYVEDNMVEWMDDAMKETIKVYTRKHGGGLGF